METILLIICGLILTAFTIRVIVWSAKFIYKIAPFIVIWTALLFLLYLHETNFFELKDQNDATVTRTVEDQSRHSWRRE